MATFGERFKQLRMEKGLTQEKLAKEFYIRKSSISKYENNIQLPEIDTIKRYSQFFDCSIDYLLGTTEIRNPYARSFTSGPDGDRACCIYTNGLSDECIKLINEYIEQLKKEQISSNYLNNSM